MRKDVFLFKQKKENVIRMGEDGASFYVVDRFLNKDSCVYSFGVGEDISFDIALIKKYGVDVFAFDPTPKSIQFIRNYSNMPKSFHFFSYGISNKVEKEKFYIPKVGISGSAIEKSRGENYIEVSMKDITSILQELKHTHIDLLKLDIEGSEYKVVDDLLDKKIFPTQLLIEFHHRFPSVGIGETIRIIERLNANGYFIIKISESREEYTFLRE